MTMLFSCAIKDKIIMSVDSAELLEYSSGEREYRECLKARSIDNLGCIGTWGARDHNKIFQFLDSLSDLSEDIDGLADSVENYLKTEYKPKELNLDDVGYHISGFNPKGEPRLHHIFWGFDVPRPHSQKEREYKKYNHSPPENEIQFLYNGRNELADTVINNLLKEIEKGQSSRIDIKNIVDLIKLASLISRFSAEITKEVSPPFHYFLISQGNKINQIERDSLCPLTEKEIDRLLA